MYLFILIFVDLFSTNYFPNFSDNNDITNVFIKTNEKNETQGIIRLEFDGRYINISLNESDSSLGGFQTPIYLAEKKEHDQFTKFRKYTIVR